MRRYSIQAISNKSSVSVFFATLNVNIHIFNYQNLIAKQLKMINRFEAQHGLTAKQQQPQTVPNAYTFFYNTLCYRIMYFNP